MRFTPAKYTRRPARSYSSTTSCGGHGRDVGGGCERTRHAQAGVHPYHNVTPNIHTRTRTYARTHTHTHRRTHTQTHTHTHTHTRPLSHTHTLTHSHTLCMSPGLPLRIHRRTLDAAPLPTHPLPLSLWASPSPTTRSSASNSSVNRPLTPAAWRESSTPSFASNCSTRIAACFCTRR